jgi:hypothetical protein
LIDLYINMKHGDIISKKETIYHNSEKEEICLFSKVKNNTVCEKLDDLGLPKAKSSLKCIAPLRRQRNEI